MITRPLMDPGLYLDLPNADYHASEGISKSGLMLFADNPEKFNHQYNLGHARADKNYFDVGQAFHVATLEPDKFEQHFVVGPDLNKNTNKWKEWVAENQDRTILSIKDYDIIMAMAKKVRTHPVASQLIREGFAEASIYAIDPETGEVVKIRPDWTNSDVMVDLKSTTDASPGKFYRDMFTYSYHVQSAMYPEVFNWVMTRQPIREFVFIVVEKDAPHSIGLYRASKEDRLIGLENFRRNLNAYSDHKLRNYWPSYNNDRIVDTSLPAWAKRNELMAELNA